MVSHRIRLSMCRVHSASAADVFVPLGGVEASAADAQYVFPHL